MRYALDDFPVQRLPAKKETDHQQAQKKLVAYGQPQFIPKDLTQGPNPPLSERKRSENLDM